jgi:hypothetical protein
VSCRPPLGWSRTNLGSRTLNWRSGGPTVG